MTERRWVAGLLLLVVGVSMLPADTPWGSLVGDPLGETDNHLWMFWREGQLLSGDGGALANAPEGVSIPLMDPVNLPIYLLLSPLGPVLAYNGMAAFSVMLSGIGAYVLARQFVDARSAGVALVAGGSAPFLAGVIDFGITESWPIGWFGIHAALLIHFARTGRLSAATGAGVSLGLVALSGWYHALLGLTLEAMLVPALLIRHRRIGIVAQGAIALAMVMPSLVQFLSIRDQWRPRWLAPAPGPPGPRPDWAELPIYGTDLLNLFLPSLSAVHPSKAVYIGVVVLALCAWGLWRRARSAGWLLLLAAVPLLLSLGYWPTVAGYAVGLPGPAWLLVKAAPELQGLSHWHRAAAAAVPFLAAAAAIGAAELPARGGLLAALIGLILVDSALLSQTAWPRTAYPITLPQSLAELPGRGGVIQVPFDNSREMFSETPARIYSRWQVIHGRQIAENYEGVDALLARSALVAAAQAACWNRNTLPPYYQPPPEMRDPEPPQTPEAIAAAVAQLDAWGFEWIVLHRDRCRVPARAIPLLDDLLGPGLRFDSGDVAWKILGAQGVGE